MSATEAHVKRPMNAFMIWSSRKRRELARQNPKLHNSQISKILGTEWRKLTEEEKQKFFVQAKLLNELHLIEHPDYKYRPKRRVKKKQLKHKPDRSTVCSFSPCYWEESCASSPPALDQNTQQQEENACSQHGSKPMSDVEDFVKKEKTDSLSGPEGTPVKEHAANSVLGRLSLQLRASKDLLSSKCEGSHFSTVRLQGNIFKDSLSFRDDHLAMLRPEIPPYYPSTLHSAAYQTQCHVLPSQFLREREAATRFLPTYSTARCSCCQPTSLRSREEFLASRGQYAFLNPPSSQYLYGRRW